MRAAKITFIRGTVDVEAIIKAACHERNAVAWNVDYSNKTEDPPFLHPPRSRPGDGPANTTSNGVSGFAWYQQSHFRLLQHSVEQLGKRVTASKSPLEDLIFPRRIKDLIQEIRAVADEQGRGIRSAASRGSAAGCCYGPPGTGKTALARAFAEELDMPIFVYNLGELTNPRTDEGVDGDAGQRAVRRPDRGHRQRLPRPRERLAPQPRLAADAAQEEGTRQRATATTRTARKADRSACCRSTVLLNCLDGVERSDGVFTIITTNDIRKVDPALGQPRTLPDGTVEFISTRPGRIDKAVELTYMEPDDKKLMARRILGLYEDEYLEMLDFIERYPESARDAGPVPGALRQIALRCFWEANKRTPKCGRSRSKWSVCDYSRPACRGTSRLPASRGR